jgi:hypothetical protein
MWHVVQVRKRKFIPMPYSSRNDYICEEENCDLVPMNPKWPVRPCVVLEEGEGLMAMVCRHHILVIPTQSRYTCILLKNQTTY